MPRNEAEGLYLDRKHNKALVPVARTLRENMTKEEKTMWYDFLRNLPIKFSRQKILGKYIVDFYSAEAKLVIEIDGSQHNSVEGKLYDSERTAYLEQYGLKVIRVPNEMINRNFNIVCKRIRKLLNLPDLQFNYEYSTDTNINF